VLTAAAAVAFDSGWRWQAVLTAAAAAAFDGGSVASPYLWRQKRVKVLAQRFSAGVRIVPELEELVSLTPHIHGTLTRRRVLHPRVCLCADERKAIGRLLLQHLVNKIAAFRTHLVWHGIISVERGARSERGRRVGEDVSV
jgi:hypothetical protein